MSSVLAIYYPRWISNCLESARWLRSGPEYDAWWDERVAKGWGDKRLPMAEREAAALAYLAEAQRLGLLLEVQS